MSNIIRFCSAVSAAVIFLTALCSKAVFADIQTIPHDFVTYEVIYEDGSDISSGISDMILGTPVTEITAVGSGYMYDMLDTDEEREFYNRLLTACLQVHESDGTYEGTPRAEFRDLIDSDLAKEIGFIFRYDHPEFFWMNTTTSVRTSSISSSMSFGIYENYQDGALRNEAAELIKSAASEYISGACEYATEYERARYLYNKLCSDISYKSGDLDQSMASVFLEKKTVCAGFSKAYDYLCNMVGVEATTSIGYNHAWNSIKLADKWYLVDVTNQLFLYSYEQMHEFDLSVGMSSIVTITDSSGEEEEVLLYMHDIAFYYYPTYYNSFPVCDTTYVSGAGDVPATTTSTTTATTTTTTVTTTTTSATTEIPVYDIVYGDTNLDSVVNLLDVVYLNKFVAGMIIFSPQQRLNSDVCADEMINSSDVYVVLKYVIESIPSLPVDP